MQESLYSIDTDYQRPFKKAIEDPATTRTTTYNEKIMIMSTPVYTK